MLNEGNKMHSLECKCFTWKPIVAGALIVIGFTFLLNLFSVAIGLTAYTTTNDGVEALVMGGLIATALGTIASMFAAGWIAGYLGSRHCTKRHLGALYGFLTWCVALIAAIFLVNHIQHYLVFYTHFISGTATPNAIPAAANSMSMVNPVTENQASKLAISAYIVFCLFFLSAFACSLGGHVGMRYTDKDNI
jgi:hypothetical protein